MDKQIIAQVANRYSRTGTRFYVRGKLGGDPICQQILELFGTIGTAGHVVDVGCGRGQMGVALLELQLATSICGFDWDQDKITEAQTATKDDSRFRFWQGDTRTEAIPSCDTVLMLDVLHYLTDDEQSALVERAATAAKRAIVIRELDPNRGWRSTTTRVQESITTFFRYNVGARVHIKPIEPVVNALKIAGFTTRVEPSWGSTPFANVAIIGTK